MEAMISSTGIRALPAICCSSELAESALPARRRISDGLLIRLLTVSDTPAEVKRSPSLIASRICATSSGVIPQARPPKSMVFPRFRSPMSISVSGCSACPSSGRDRSLQLPADTLRTQFAVHFQIPGSEGELFRRIKGQAIGNIGADHLCCA